MEKIDIEAKDLELKFRSKKDLYEIFKYNCNP